MVQRYNFLGRRKNLPLSLCGHAGLCGLPRKNPGAPIPADARIVHKTGTGFPSPEGLQDMNDAGIILMPDGNHVIIAVFTTKSPSEAVIANIARQLLAQ